MRDGARRITFCFLGFILHGKNNGVCLIQQRSVTVQNDTLVSLIAL